MSDTLKTCESNTPETDNFIVSAGYVRTDHQWRTFARKLESERNSLQDQRDFAMGEIERLRKERDDLRERCNALEVGRDFWRADLTEARQCAVAYRDAYLAEAFHVEPTKEQNILLELDENTLPWELPAHLQPPNRNTETPKH